MTDFMADDDDDGGFQMLFSFTATYFRLIFE